MYARGFGSDSFWSGQLNQLSNSSLKTISILYFRVQNWSSLSFFFTLKLGIILEFKCKKYTKFAAILLSFSFYWIPNFLVSITPKCAPTSAIVSKPIDASHWRWNWRRSRRRKWPRKRWRGRPMLPRLFHKSVPVDSWLGNALTFHGLNGCHNGRRLQWRKSAKSEFHPRRIGSFLLLLYFNFFS